MKPGDQYEGVAIIKQLTGRVDAREDETNAGVPPASRTGSQSRSSSRGRPTKEQLYNHARRLNIEGRSRMTRAQLERAVARH
jgi:hypothetical protein